jgi:hypothetical protein
METIVRKVIVGHMIQNKLFSDKQFGFISGRSFTLQLLIVMEEWTEILDNGGTMDSIYMDFKLLLLILQVYSYLGRIYHLFK